LAKNSLLKGSALLFNFLSPNKEFTNMFESKNRKGNLAGTKQYHLKKQQQQQHQTTALT
jgi:hypothetical protein